MEQIHRQWDFTKLVRLFHKQEVKTPLGFAYRTALLLAGIWALLLYAPVSEHFKWSFIWGSSAVLGGIFIIVMVIALCKPTSLLYGEAGHRAERKLEYGTESKRYDEGELNLLEKEQNVRELPGGGQ